MTAGARSHIAPSRAKAIVGLSLWVLLTAVLHRQRPDLDWRVRLMSAYGSGPYWPLARASNMSLAAAAVAVAAMTEDPVANTLLRIAGGGLALDAVVAMEPGSDLTARVRTVGGFIHLASAVVAFGSITLAAVRLSPGGRSPLLRCLAWGSVGGFVALILAAGPLVLRRRGGLVQRVYAATVAAWALAYSLSREATSAIHPRT